MLSYRLKVSEMCQSPMCRLHYISHPNPQYFEILIFATYSTLSDLCNATYTLDFDTSH